MMPKNRMLLFLLYLVFGLYFINHKIGFIAIPESFLVIDSWAIFIGGFLILVGGISFMRARRIY